MKMYEIRTECECLIKTDDGEVLLDENKALQLSSPQKVLVYPLGVNGKNKFPFFINLADQKSGRFFKHYNLGEESVYLISFPQLIQNENIETVQVSGKTCEITLSEEKLTFACGATKKSIYLDTAFDSYSIFTEGNFVILYLTGEQEDMWFYNTEKNSTVHLFGEKIEKVDNQILVSRKSFGITQDQLYQSFEVVGDELVQKKTTVSHLSQPHKVSSPTAVPIAFLEALKDNNYELARSYLSERLLLQVSDEHLQSYFGKFNKIIPLSNGRVLIASESKHSVFRFTVVKEFIDEIEIME